MSKFTSASLDSNRRSNVRVNYHCAVRFVRDPAYPLHLAYGISQDISLRGLQLLSPIVLEKRTPFELWVCVEGNEMIPATAETAWMSLEDSLGDSPYWIRSGVTLIFKSHADRDLVAQAILKRANVDRIMLEQTESRIGFVF